MNSVVGIVPVTAFAGVFRQSIGARTDIFSPALPNPTVVFISSNNWSSRSALTVPIAINGDVLFARQLRAHFSRVQPQGLVLPNWIPADAPPPDPLLNVTP